MERTALLRNMLQLNGTAWQERLAFVSGVADSIDWAYPGTAPAHAGGGRLKSVDGRVLDRDAEFGVPIASSLSVRGNLGDSLGWNFRLFGQGGKSRPPSRPVTIWIVPF
jgi:hypothetical protein